VRTVIGARMVAALGLCAALLAGCASGPPSVELPPGTLLLGEVQHVLTRSMVDAGEFAPGDIREGLGGELRAGGFTDAQIDAGRVVVIRDRIYWNNTVSGIKHSILKPALVIEGLVVEPGNVVEIEGSQRPRAVVRRVRAMSLAAGSCFYGDVPVGAAVEALGVLSLVGPRGSASLYCSGIEKEGWQRPRTYWHKLPGAAGAATTAAPVPTPVDPTEAASAPPAPVPAADDMATLLLYLVPRYPALPFFFALPVWIDDHKVAALDQGTCALIRVPPGTHRVVAGSSEQGLMRTHGRRELSISVGAGDKLVLEYRIDDDALKQSERFFESREKWESRIYHFTQRPATPQDSCAIRHMAPTLGR
jgi:hypothetical protein